MKWCDADGISAVDENLGLVYVPPGSSSPDIWGGGRSPDKEHYDSALIALDITTGKLRWSFQNVHHDVWDMDMPSQPSRVDLRSNGRHHARDLYPGKSRRRAANRRR